MARLLAPVLLFTSATAAAIPPPRPAVTDGTVRGGAGRAIDARLTRLAADGFSGVVLAARGGEVLLAKGYGLADRGTNRPWTTDTVFDIGSVTKPFTAAAVLKLAEAGRLRVTDPITRHFADVPADKAGVTLHHLLTHTAGFVDSLGDDYDRIGRDEFVALALASKLRTKPGEKYHYSNVGYSLLGAVIERATGGTYEKYLREALFEPAGMTRTGYALPDWGRDGLARGYLKDKDWGTPRDRPWAEDGPYWHLRANGGLLSTAADLYRWHLALEGDGVLSKAAREEAFTPHVREGRGGGSYGYGWAIGTAPGGKPVVGHNGSNGVFFADLRYYPADGVFLVLATNASGLKHLGELGRVREVLDAAGTD